MRQEPAATTRSPKHLQLAVFLDLHLTFLDPAIRVFLRSQRVCSGVFFLISGVFFVDLARCIHVFLKIQGVFFGVYFLQIWEIFQMYFRVYFC